MIQCFGTADAHVSVQPYKPSYPADAPYKVQIVGGASIDTSEANEYAAAIMACSAEVTRLNNEMAAAKAEAPF